jgi:hypothetical protein
LKGYCSASKWHWISLQTMSNSVVYFSHTYSNHRLSLYHSYQSFVLDLINDKSCILSYISFPCRSICLILVLILLCLKFTSNQVGWHFAASGLANCFLHTPNCATILDTPEDFKLPGYLLPTVTIKTCFRRILYPLYHLLLRLQ